MSAITSSTQNTAIAHEDAALLFAELGHPVRLAIFKLLVKAGKQGIAVGELQKNLQIPGSTLSHHVKRMREVALVKQIREGRVLLCIANLTLLQHLVDFLLNECCIGLDGQGEGTC